MKGKVSGFTLIELLVVIAIIALLLAVVMPGLNLAKQKAGAIVCMSNIKNLSVAWILYKEENNEILVAGCMKELRDGTPPWVREPYQIIPGDLNDKVHDKNVTVTDEDEIRGIRDGALYPYIDAPDDYRCPSNHSKSIHDKTDRLNVYAVSRCLHGIDNYDRQIIKYTEITSPSSRYCFVESGEEKNWCENGRWSVWAPEYSGNPGVWEWWSPVAVSHGDASTFGFCDGHAQTKKWKYASTKERCHKLELTGARNYDHDPPKAGQYEDLDWIAAGWAYRWSGN